MSKAWIILIFYKLREIERGKSPYDLLGLHVPSSDWWQLLQMPPEELEQKLLTQ